MNYLPLMTDDEIQYICSVIHPQSAIDYFRQRPKAFAKVFPGFRPNTMGRYNIPELLFRYRNQGFISSFIEDHISHWLPEIKEHLDKCMKEGASKDAAYIQTLPQSFFAGNVPLYLKLIEEEHPEDYISLLSSAVVEVKNVSEDQEKLKADAESKTAKIESLQAELVSVKTALNKSKKKQLEHDDEIKSLKREICNVDDLNVLLQSKEEAIATLEDEVCQIRKSEKDLKAELKSAQSGRKQLEAQIREEIEKQQSEKIAKHTAAPKPLHPIDMDEFEEYLGYNLKDIGAATPLDCYLLLKQHLCNILFQGMPIIINRGTGTPLMKCIANALVANANITMLTYNKNISSEDVETFLYRDARVVCLDGFLGNYCETELFALLERHRNKIIFLTLAYDRTLRYVPYEIFRYCNYLNINRIQTLSINADVTEDPSAFEETEADIPEVNPDARFSPLLKDVLALDTLGDEKNALFVVIPDTDTTFNFIAAILYTQMFNLLCDKAKKCKGGKLPVHVRCILDEFANIGKIPNFEILITTIRSREISACIILQTKSQLKAAYKDHAETIAGNCDSFLFLGGKEDSTIKDISEMLGKETIDSRSTSENIGKDKSHGQSYQRMGRDLMSKDEIATMDGGKCIVQIKGCHPFFSKKYNLHSHKNYPLLSDSNPKNEFDPKKYLARRGRVIAKKTDIVHIIEVV